MAAGLALPAMDDKNLPTVERLMWTLLLTPLADEFTLLLEAFQAMGYDPVLRNMGNLPVYEHLKMIMPRIAVLVEKLQA